MSLRRRELVGWPLAFLAGPSRAASEPVACLGLTVGNSNYRRNVALPNAVADVRLLGGALTSAGVQVEALDNVSSDALRQAIRRVSRAANASNAAFWFSYSGHAVQLDGRNYLECLDSDFSTPAGVRSTGVGLDEIIGWTKDAGIRASVITLDACRSEAFSGQPSRGSAGLAPVESAGLLVGFSTAPYAIARDGSKGQASPYAIALAAALRQRPAMIEAVFRDAANAVYESTRRQQVPEYRSSLRTQWVFGTRGIELQPMPAPGAGAPDSGGSAARQGSYRPDMRETVRIDRTADAWDAADARLERAMRNTDRPEAPELIRRGKQAGASDEAITMAGALLHDGKLIERDRTQAAQLYLRAAQNGYVPAQVRLGELMFEREDAAEAWRWISRAAESGMKRALLDRAQLHMTGVGVAADPVGGLAAVVQGAEHQHPAFPSVGVEMIWALRAIGRFISGQPFYTLATLMILAGLVFGFVHERNRTPRARGAAPAPVRPCVGRLPAGCDHARNQESTAGC